MSVFHPGSNTTARVVLFLVALLVVGGVGFLLLWARTPYFTDQALIADQPLQFDHRHHVADEGIDCRYCHWTVETSATAGVPSSDRCMGCHSQIWNKGALLEPLRQSYFGGAPLQWRRIHQLPDFVYFNHAIHVAKGVGCVTCHGRVDQMATVQQFAPLNMGWCLECHRDPDPFLRPREEITSMTWQPESAAQGAELAKQYDVHTRTSCTTCHR